MAQQFTTRYYNGTAQYNHFGPRAAVYTSVTPNYSRNSFHHARVTSNSYRGFGGAPYESAAYAAPVEQRRGLGTGAAVGLGVGALAAGGLAGYALGGGFSGGDSPPREEINISTFSEGGDFGGDDWMD